MNAQTVAIDAALVPGAVIDLGEGSTIEVGTV